MLNYAERGKGTRRRERILMALHTEDKELEQVGHRNASPLPPAAVTTGKSSFGSSRSSADGGLHASVSKPYLKCKQAWKPLKYDSSSLSHSTARRIN